MNGDTIGALVMFAIALAIVVHCLREWLKELRRCDVLIAAGLPVDKPAASITEES